MRLSICCVAVLVVLSSGCGGHSPTTPSAAALSISITPNPLSVPDPGQPMPFKVTVTETAGVGVNLDRDEVLVVDSDGKQLAQRSSFSKSGGCAFCTGQPHIGARQTAIFTEVPLTFAQQPPRAGTFTYTVFYTDDLGHSNSSTAQVSVR